MRGRGGSPRPPVGPHTCGPVSIGAPNRRDVSHSSTHSPSRATGGQQGGERARERAPARRAAAVDEAPHLARASRPPSSRRSTAHWQSRNLTSGSSPAGTRRHAPRGRQRLTSGARVARPRAAAPWRRALSDQSRNLQAGRARSAQSGAGGRPGGWAGTRAHARARRGRGRQRLTSGERPCGGCPAALDAAGGEATIRGPQTCHGGSGERQ